MMTTYKVLVTGGAGFIGSHIVDKLIESKHDVTILDTVAPPEHENTPAYLNKEAKLVKGSVLDEKLISDLLKDNEVIYHEASVVGIAQSNYQPARFVENNVLGTARLLDVLFNSKNNVKKLIVAASNTSYGEGLYKCDHCGVYHPDIRTKEEVEKYGWDPVCPKCKKPGMPVPTPETTELNCNSIYAYTKRDQENFSMFMGKLYGLPVVALRYFNCFGPRQSLNNPYTGVSSIFSNRIKNNNPPVIYEDGLQSRDFVSVYDVAEVNRLVINSKNAENEIINVATGVPISITEVANELIRLHKKDLKPKITGEFRKGDIRHCIADITKLKSKLDYDPKFTFRHGLKKLFDWSLNEKSDDKFINADGELKSKGLI